MSIEPGDTPSKARLLRTILWGTITAALAGLAIFWALDNYLGNGSKAVRYSGEADIRSEFSLIDHTGQEVTQADYADRWQLVFFGFTNCPDVCPTTLAYMASVLDLLGKDADQVAPIFITVDPERDTPEALAKYVSNRAFPDNLVGLTGTADEIKAAADEFYAGYNKVETPESLADYTMDHTSLLYLMDENWQLKTFFAEGNSRPDEMAACLEELLGS